MKKLRYVFEGLSLSLLMIIFKLMPLDTASAVGGFIGRSIGPRLAASRKALRNIELALPELSPEQRQAALTGMWDNLGRVMAEFPHLETIASTRVMTDNHPAAAKLMRENKPCMMIAGHCGNWEIAGPSFLLAFKFPMDITYRAPNNPWSEKLLMKARSLGGRVQGYSKSRSGGMGLVRAMKEGRCIGMLIDQKYNEGIAVPFFGHPAMTTPAFVEMSRKYGYTLIPTRLERLSGAHFKITTYEPLVLGGRTTKDVIGQAHGYLEDWIRDKPAQWLWLHRRWGKVEPEEMKDTA